MIFENTLIILDQNEINHFNHFFQQNEKSTIYILTENTKNKIEESLKIQLQFSIENESGSFQSEIQSFLDQTTTRIKNKNSDNFNSFNKLILKSIAGYLIKKSYQKSFKFDRITNYSIYLEKYKELTVNQDEYIVFKKTNCNHIYLIYHFEREELFILKVYLDENLKNFEREHLNYLNIHYPLFPIFFGITNYYSYRGIIIEYIQGKSLNLIKEMKMNYEMKLKIIFQIMIGIQYLHFNQYIYCDLKPNNIIVNKNGSISIIDFDNMINNSHKDKKSQIFQHEFIAPEILTSDRITNRADIYSIGKIIDFIFSDEFGNKEYSLLKNLTQKCTIKDAEKRPEISQLIDCFYFDFFSLMSKIDETDTIKNNPNIHNESYFDFWFFISENSNALSQFILGNMHYSGKFINKDPKKIIKYFTFSANQNNVKSQLILGEIYEKGVLLNDTANNGQSTHMNLNEYDKYIAQDINKSIYFNTLAANNNDSDAQFHLGYLYEMGEYVKKDMDKSIHYYTLAANNNDSDAQCQLGYLYEKGEYVEQDIYKSILYYKSAAENKNPNAILRLGYIYEKGDYLEQDINIAIKLYTIAAEYNDPVAQFKLGLLYDEGKYVEQDINKSIFYYTLAANQNISMAQFRLGYIYNDSSLIPIDINKSIKYYTLASDQNDFYAQINLGLIYIEGKYIRKNVDKAIYFFTLAANQNVSIAQYYLGLIYLFELKDINKSIKYFTISANNNYPAAQFSLGYIYETGEYTIKDINKSIYYYTLAANQNCINAQLNLGLIYLTNKYIKYDINKSIHYLTLAANQNCSKAHYVLGYIYYYNGIVQQDINKSIHYLTLAANQNDPDAQYMLGLIYDIGAIVQKDVNKSVQYFLLAARQNHPAAQLQIGYIYLEGEILPFNVTKSIQYLSFAANNREIDAYFYLGTIFFKGIEISRNIDKAIHFYREGSCFNDNYCKNNLGIIYKNIRPNSNAIVYFEEAIRQKNDIVSMYNLAHIYFYGKFIEINIDKSINLLINSSNNGFAPSQFLLSLIIVKRIHLVNAENIKFEVEKYGNCSTDLNNKIYDIIKKYNLENEHDYELIYLSFEKNEFLYDQFKSIILFNEFMEDNEKPATEISIDHTYDLTHDFYEGFGLELL